jgi:hypothetical protein
MEKLFATGTALATRTDPTKEVESCTPEVSGRTDPTYPR